MKNDLSQFLGGMTPQDFLKNYWQKKPLFVKGALSNLDSLASPRDLMDMAQDENFETRMVKMKGKNNPWDAKVGPFLEKDFPRNELDRWTLVVHNLELYFKEFREIKDMVNFIPSWQFDDIMSTYSVAGSSVGAHIDNYNVFIFQGMGKRQWQLNENPDETYIEELPIKLLTNFEVESEYTLEEGDLLYLPPGVAHHGISLTESISYSLGYKSFDYTNMAAAFCGEFLQSYDSSNCLRTTSESLPENINEITDSHLDGVMDFFLKEVVTRENVKKWFGQYITAPRNEIKSDDEQTGVFERGIPLFRDEFLRFNFYKLDENIQLIANEREYNLSKSDYKTLENILETPSYEEISLPDNLSSSVLEVMNSLIDQGALFHSYE